MHSSIHLLSRQEIYRQDVAKQKLADLSLVLPSPLETLHWPEINNSGLNKPDAKPQSLAPSNYIQVLCKRDDLIHPIISGNKWRKLAPTINDLVSMNAQHIISFGGGYSNHLHALSYICFHLQIKLTAIIRGDYSHNPSPMLRDLQRWKTNIQYVNKIGYKKRTETSYCDALLKQFGADIVIPEGGSNAACKRGFIDMVKEIETQLASAEHSHITHVVVPVASGGTMAGLINGFRGTRTKIVGIAMLKGQGYLEGLVKDLLSIEEPSTTKKDKSTYADWEILHDYHHGGYAKSSTQLLDFITQFNSYCANCHNAKTPLALEPVYSGKCFYALNDLMTRQYFGVHSKVMIIHTGGLQAART